MPPSTSVQRGQSCPVASAVCFQQRGHFSLVEGRTMTVYAASSRMSGKTVCVNCSDQAHLLQLDQGSCLVTGPAVPQKQSCSTLPEAAAGHEGYPPRKHAAVPPTTSSPSILITKVPRCVATSLVCGPGSWESNVVFDAIISSFSCEVLDVSSPCSIWEQQRDQGLNPTPHRAEQ